MKKILFLAIAFIAITLVGCQTGKVAVTNLIAEAREHGKLEVKVDTVKNVTTVTAKLDSLWDAKQAKAYFTRFNLYGDMLNGSGGVKLTMRNDSIDALKANGWARLVKLVKEQQTKQKAPQQ